MELVNGVLQALSMRLNGIADTAIIPIDGPKADALQVTLHRPHVEAASPQTVNQKN